MYVYYFSISRSWNVSVWNYLQDMYSNCLWVSITKEQSSTTRKHHNHISQTHFWLRKMYRAIHIFLSHRRRYFWRFNYHSLIVKVTIIFKINEKVKKTTTSNILHFSDRWITSSLHVLSSIQILSQLFTSEIIRLNLKWTNTYGFGTYNIGEQ